MKSNKDAKAVICPPCGEQSLAPEGFNPGATQATKRGTKLEKTLWSLLPRLAALLPPQGREMSHGFTLIELLVVVLIIGILAAVTLPQYNKAVKKTQGTELLSALDTFDKAVSDYYLEHGSYDNITADSLGIQMPTLKHWEYLNGGTAGRTADFQVGSGGGYFVNLHIVDKKTGNLFLQARWENGKLVDSKCKQNEQTCNTYFNCDWVTVKNGWSLKKVCALKAGIAD